MAQVEIVVNGNPGPQGSKVAGVRKNGTGFVRESNPKAQRDWRQDVVAGVTDYRQLHNLATIEGPTRVAIDLRVPRPPSVSIRKFPYPTKKPDIDKLTRNTLDGLKQAGLIRDDSQIIDIIIRKRYATDDPFGSPGATIRLDLVPPPEII